MTLFLTVLIIFIAAQSYEENIQIEMQKKHELYEKYYGNKKHTK